MTIGLGFTLWPGRRAAPGGTPSPLPRTLTLAAFSLDRNVYDTGGAFGRNAALVPLSGTADPGEVVQARAVTAAGGAPHTGWADVATADAGGNWTGALGSIPRSGANWLRIETRLKAAPAVTASMARIFAAGHVVAFMGQSELYRTFTSVGSGRDYDGVLASPDQCQMVNCTATFLDQSGNPGSSTNFGIDHFYTDRGFIGNAASWTNGNVARPDCAEHIADLIQKNGIADRFLFLSLALPGTGRVDMADDARITRRWSDDVAVLDAAGWADGVRPGLVVDMWTNADEAYATNFMTAFRPFYTGRLDSGAAYTLGTNLSVTQFSALTATNIRFDHILFDLTGQGRGLFNPAETRMLWCHHRYDIGSDHQNWVVTAGGTGIDTSMWGQEMVRTALRQMPSDPDFGQVGKRGTEPLNYENGFSPSGSTWGDHIHPGQGDDGLALFARHLGHAALHGLGLVSQVIPAFDQAAFDPAGMYADFASSAGPVTTTRKMRGLADPSPEPGTHWTDVFGFEFDGVPVTRAEIQPSGAVRVHVPAAAAPANWTRSRFTFGRGGGTGHLFYNQDPLAKGWLNYPVVAGLVPGMGDDQLASSGTGIALRPLAPDAITAPAAYRAAAVGVPAGIWFEDPAAVGSGVTQLRFAMRAAFLGNVTTTYFFGVESQIRASMNKALQGQMTFWASGGTSALTAQRLVLPGKRHDLVFALDMVANTASFSVDGVTWMSMTILGTQNAVNNVRTIGVLGHSFYAATDRPGWEFESLRIWKNDPTGAGTPHKTLLASSGAAALNADAWKRGTGSVS